MKSLNLKVALILLTMGTVVILVGLTPRQGTLGCMLAGDACAQFAAQAAAIQFLVFSFSAIALITTAAFLLISGRNRGQSQPASSP